MTHILAMCLILALAGLVQGVSGFGFGLIAVGLLALLWPDPKTATVIPLLPNLMICGYALYRHRKEVPWDRVLPFIGASMLGVPVGVWLLSTVDIFAVYLGIGLLLVFSAVYGWLPTVGKTVWHRFYLGLPLGVFSGCLGGAFNTGGPPAIAYMTNQQLTRFAIVGGLQAIFLLGNSFRLVCLIPAGLLPPEVAAYSLLGAATAIAGIVLGTHLLHKLSDRLMSHLVRVGQLVLGGVYFIRALLIA